MLGDTPESAMVCQQLRQRQQAAAAAQARAAALLIVFSNKNTQKHNNETMQDENSTHTHERKGNACFEPHFSSFVMSTDVSVGKALQ